MHMWVGWVSFYVSFELGFVSIKSIHCSRDWMSGLFRISNRVLQVDSLLERLSRIEQVLGSNMTVGNVFIESWQ